MKILRTVDELRAWRKASAGKVGLVPTMGALHTGHLSLVASAKAQTDRTIASIFVNPLQFGPQEDLASYPRPFAHDCDLLVEAGTDALFAPEAAEVYAAGASTYVNEEAVSLPLCGAQRPGHFRGVTTVVLKLFNLVQPDVAFFGRKDYQQCAVIRRMVRDLNVPVEVVTCPTVRELDGLAMSSRNVYLSPEERARAPQLHRGLEAAASLYRSGVRDGDRLREAGLAALDAGFKVQYWDVRHRDTLEDLTQGGHVGVDGAVLAVAAYLGKTRLIDNIEI